MNTDQKKVAVGAASGVISMALLVFLFYSILPTISGMDTILDRFIFTLRLNVIAVIPFFIGVAIVGNGRFFSKAIDPLRHAEDRAMEINGRVVDNTLQQNFVFFIGTLALSTFLSSSSIKLIPALVVVYILARIIFWIGYRIDPLYRAPGMAATSYMNVGILLSVLYFLLFSPLIVLAQNGGSAPPSGTSSAATPAIVATSTAATTSQARPGGSQTPSPTSTVPTSAPASVNPTVSATPSPQATSSTQDTGTNPLLWVALAVLALIPFGFLAAQSLKNRKTRQDKKDNSQCFNIKKLLDEKLAELTDLKGILAGKAQDTAKAKIRESLRGTSPGDVLIFIEKAEKEYGRLKKLFEECTVEFERNRFEGRIIESSLSNKSILDKVHIKKTYQSGDRTLHMVSVREEQIPELSNYLADGPWYIHLWKRGTDNVRVVFKHKVFNIKASDKSTWADAVAYGQSLGIPLEQLNFPIE